MTRGPSRLVLAVLALGAFAGLFLEGVVHHDVGRASTRKVGAPLAGLATSGAVLDISGPTIRSTPPPANEIALTFDDGPDPRWTPKVLAILRRHHVPATFFVVGSEAIEHPGLIHEERAEGDEVGSHTFTHADLASVSAWRANLELSLTETALAGADGFSTSLLRMPYSSTTDSLTASQYRAAQRAAALGYLVVTATLDPQDWSRPGVGKILVGSLPPIGSGAVVLLHDGGGDRAQTVAALDDLITQLQARGDRLVTIAELAGLPPSAVMRPADRGTRLRGVGLRLAVRSSTILVGLLTLLMFPVLILAVVRALLAVTLARRHASAAGRRDTPQRAQPVTVLVPAYNEEVGIEAALRSLLATTYSGRLRIIVIDDGCTDGTSERAVALGRPEVTVVHQPNQGKAAALNRGLADTTDEIVVMVDADTVFEPETIGWLVAPFADPTVGAVSGNTKVANRRGLLGRWQHLEYVQGFNLDRRMYDVLRCMPTVPGAVGAFRRTALVEVGGVSSDTLAEDTDLTMAITRAGWRVVYEERARAWTEAPSSLGALWRQRYRWSYGTLQAMWKHRQAVRQGGPLGRFGLPYLLLFQVVLPALAPLVDIFALYGLLFLNPWPIVALWGGFNLLQLAMAAYALRLDGERLRDLWVLPLQQFVYRQLMYLVVVQSVTSALAGTRNRWHPSSRQGVSLPA